MHGSSVKRASYVIFQMNNQMQEGIQLAKPQFQDESSYIQLSTRKLQRATCKILQNRKNDFQVALSNGSSFQTIH